MFLSRETDFVRELRAFAPPWNRDRLLANISLSGLLTIYQIEDMRIVFPFFSPCKLVDGFLQHERKVTLKNDDL